VETYGTESDPRRDFAAELSREFDLRPQRIIETLDLLRPIYYPNAVEMAFRVRRQISLFPNSKSET
jgi:S-adenosylmethionine synthetase